MFEGKDARFNLKRRCMEFVAKTFIVTLAGWFLITHLPTQYDICIKSTDRINVYTKGEIECRLVGKHGVDVPVRIVQ